MPLRIRLLTLFLVLSACLPLGAASPPAHDQFHVALFITADSVERMKDPAWLQQSWDEISSQVKVDKVYIESYHRGVLVDDALLESVKSFFKAHGVEVAGAIAFNLGTRTPENTGLYSPTDPNPGHTIAFSYTDPKERAEVQHISEVTARHFDEIILDDFFSTNTRYDSDIAAKGSDSWSQFRLRLMAEVSRDLVVGPARAVNPKVKVIIKFPNWYERLQDRGYGLDREPSIFDGMYTGTETRDPTAPRWGHMQQYQSYEIIRYYDNASPGRNGGGWVDSLGILYVDRYAEQLWDTMFAKAPQIILFPYGGLLQQPVAGDRKAWSGLDTTFNYAGLEKWHEATGSPAPVNYATVAGYSLSKVNAVLGKLGIPIGLASYKPYQSTGEVYLHNYLGMIGVPIELHPEFPADAKTVLLTESAQFDPEIVSKIKAHLEKGGNVVITSGLLQALQGKGIEQITGIHATGNMLKVHDYWNASGTGEGANLGVSSDVLVPEIASLGNDASPVVRGTANGRAAPLLLMDRYAKGILFVLTIPENFDDLYSLPQPVLTSIKQYLLADFPVQIDAPSKVSLFAYDNRTFVVESFLDHPTQVTVSTLGPAKRLRNLDSGEVVKGKHAPYKESAQKSRRTEFHIEVAPHSFVAFAEE